MHGRLLIMLTLLSQQFALPVLMNGEQGSGAECQAASCCAVIETITCCGDVVSEMRCGMTGGEQCLCDAEPGDSSPVPFTPKRGDLGPTIFVAPVAIAIDAHAPVRMRFCSSPPALHRTNNETQALLCIWRT